jgi:hypothetical protein
MTITINKQITMNKQYTIYKLQDKKSKFASQRKKI